MSEAEQKKHQMQLMGTVFNEDNEIVCQKLKAATAGTDAWTWMEMDGCSNLAIPGMAMEPGMH